MVKSISSNRREKRGKKPFRFYFLLNRFTFFLTVNKSLFPLPIFPQKTRVLCENVVEKKVLTFQTLLAEKGGY